MMTVRGSLAKAGLALPLGVARLRLDRQTSFTGITHGRLRRRATLATHGGTFLLRDGGGARDLMHLLLECQVQRFELWLDHLPRGPARQSGHHSADTRPWFGRWRPPGVIVCQHGVERG